MFDVSALGINRLLSGDSALMVLSLCLGIVLGLFWSGRAFPRRLPPANPRHHDRLRRSF